MIKRHDCCRIASKGPVSKGIDLIGWQSQNDLLVLVWRAVSRAL